jgi:PAS domain S-box-containing protein
LLLLVGGGSLYVGFLYIKNSEKKRIHTLEELYESNFFLEESQSIAHFGTYALDIKTGFWTSSEILDKIFGINSEFVRNVEGWLEIVHPDEREEMQNYFNRHVLTDHQPFDKKYRILRINDQQERWVHGLGKLSFDEQGNPVRMMGTIQDITDRQQANKKLKSKIAQLARLNKYMVGRELKMIEMKKEVDNLCEKAGLPRRYNVPDE